MSKEIELMENHNKKLDIFSRYYRQINVVSNIFVQSDIPEKKLQGAMSKYAFDVERNSILGLYDITMTGNGKNGFLFTDDLVYSLEPLSTPQKLYYRDIVNVEIGNIQKEKDEHKSIIFTLNNGERREWTTPLLKKTPLCTMFKELMDVTTDDKGTENSEEISSDSLSDYEKKLSILNRYYYKIPTTTGFFLKRDIPEKRLNNARAKYAYGLDVNTILGMLDTTVMGSGKDGFIFTDSKVYYYQPGGTPGVIGYDDIKEIVLDNVNQPKDNEKHMIFKLKDGRSVRWYAYGMNKTPMYEFFEEILQQFFNVDKENDDKVVPIESIEPVDETKEELKEPIKEESLEPIKEETVEVCAEESVEKIIETVEANSEEEEFEEILVNEYDKEYFFDKKFQLFLKYYNQMAENGMAYNGRYIPEKILNNAISTYAKDVDKDRILGLIDTTLTSNGKDGYLFTDTCMYYREAYDSGNKIKYEDISRIEVKKFGKKESLHIVNKGNFEYHDFLGIKISLLNNFLSEIKKLESEEKEAKKPVKKKVPKTKTEIHSDNKDYVNGISIDYKDKTSQSAEIAGITIEHVDTVNKIYDETKFNAIQGHGFAAERANNQYDKIRLHKAKILGDDNQKSGADRIVDGVEIQSKYCANGFRCIDSCFGEDGMYKYIASDGGPMVVEVPFDKEIYDAAVKEMQKRIADGKVKGVTNPEEAEKYVRRGHYTLEQVKLIQKAGNIESLKYDAIDGFMIAGKATGITFAITFAVAKWNGQDTKVAIKEATLSGIQVFGKTFAITVISNQIAKSAVNSALVGPSEAIANKLGTKGAEMLANTFRSGKHISGTAAVKSSAKIIRGNMIAAGVTIAVVSSVDVANIFRGRISGAQLFKNMAGTTATTVAGIAGGIGGKAISTKVLGGAGAKIGTMICPGLGTAIGAGVGIVGGMVGSIVLGNVAGKAVNKVTSIFIEDDAKKMVKIIEDRLKLLATDYLMSKEEVESVVERMSNVLDGNMLKNMFAADNREAFADEYILRSEIEAVIKKRPKVIVPESDAVADSLVEVLEEYNEQVESQLLE